MKKYLMGCGHVSNATMGGKPVCAICRGIDDGAQVVVHEVVGSIGLEDRKARCVYCKQTIDSNWNLPFFNYLPHNDFDEYYDGCRGWD